MEIRALLPQDAEQFRALRLRGLLECPTAFASSYAEEQGHTIEVVAERLSQKSDASVLGAFEGSALVGVVGVQREPMAKLAHKTFIWGLYVAPEARNACIGGALMARALQYASAQLGARQVNLGVNTANTAALALYRKLGFEEYGHERGFLLVDGVLYDEYHMVCDVT
jgi:ribosomal protein S18 acetylase RimI-like enzyme